MRESLLDQARASCGEGAVKELRQEMAHDEIFKHCHSSHEERNLNDLYGYNVHVNKGTKIGYSRKFSENLAKIKGLV